MRKTILSVLAASMLLVSAPVMAQSPLDGFSAGLNFGLPVVKGVYLKDVSGINVGLLIGTPYQLPVGPLTLGVGAEFAYFSFGDRWSGIAALGTIEIGLNGLIPAELPVLISSQIGGGYFGAGLGTTIGGAIDIPLENLNLPVPLVVKLFARGNATMSAGDGQDNSTGWVNIGASLMYPF